MPNTVSSDLAKHKNENRDKYCSLWAAHIDVTPFKNAPVHSDEKTI